MSSLEWWLVEVTIPTWPYFSCFFLLVNYWKSARLNAVANQPKVLRHDPFQSNSCDRSFHVIFNQPSTLLFFRLVDFWNHLWIQILFHIWFHVNSHWLYSHHYELSDRFMWFCHFSWINYLLVNQLMIISILMCSIEKSPISIRIISNFQANQSYMIIFPWGDWCYQFPLGIPWAISLDYPLVNSHSLRTGTSSCY